MNEAVIFQSPHAIKPKIYLTKAEREERYRTRLDETFRPYTVLDVLTRVYRHRPEADLDEALGKNLGAFVSLERGNSVSRAWVADCRIIRVETLFFQPLDDFLVELCVQAAIRMEIVRSGRPDVKRTKTLNRELRLQYRFDLRPCKLTCQFTGVIVNKADSLLALNPDAIRADKYFLPILREEDYPDLARMLMSMDGVPKGALLDAEALIKGILAAFAQEESRSLSENAKWGIRKRFEAGIPKRTYIFGYTYDKQGNYVIVPEQAETVRYIFDLYETGRYSMHQIAQKLMAEKRPSAYVNNWDASHVHCILTNEKYVGDVLMQKKYW